MEPALKISLHPCPYSISFLESVMAHAKLWQSISTLGLCILAIGLDPFICISIDDRWRFIGLRKLLDLLGLLTTGKVRGIGKKKSEILTTSISPLVASE